MGLAGWSRSARVGKVTSLIASSRRAVAQGGASLCSGGEITPFIASSIMGLGVARAGVAAGQPRSARGEKVTPFIASLIMGLGVGMRWGGGTASRSLAGMRGVGVKWSALAWRGG